MALACGSSLSIRAAVVQRDTASLSSSRLCENVVSRVKIGASSSSSRSTAPPRRLRVQAQASDVAVSQDLIKSTQVKEKLPVVNSHNEWSLLEEVIVGTVEGASFCPLHIAEKQVVKKQYWDMFNSKAGQPFPAELIANAAKELDYLAEVLYKEGVKVRRPSVPNPDDFSKSFKTPDFECQSGLYAAMPRDVLIVVGNEIIEAPMGWRSRFFEYRAYRKLIKEYFREGAKWTAAPKPQMSDELYVSESEFEGKDQPGDWATTEFEPIFDAAEFMRFGKDIFTQRSGVTNYTGIQWMQRNIGDDYRIHILDFQTGPDTMHLDADFVPLAPGKLLLNPDRPCTTGPLHSTFTYKGKTLDLHLPEMFKGWEIFQAATPELSPAKNPLYFTSPWIATANVLSIDENRVLVEAHETECINAFKAWGFTPVPVPLRNFMALGGSFHCATVDVRRQSKLESYF